MSKKAPGTEAPIAPQPDYKPAPLREAPRQKRIERQGARTEPVTARYPRVIGGVCEFCGTIDKNVPAQFQYKLCPHYRGMQLACSYCAESKEPDEVVYHANLNVAASPADPNTLIVWCDSYECSRAHEKRFRISK